jgi:hypothetical protein
MPSLPLIFERPTAKVVEIVLRDPKIDIVLRPLLMTEESEERPRLTDCVERPERVVDKDERPYGV